VREVKSDKTEEDMTDDPDLKWIKNGIFIQTIDPGFYDALSRVLTGREQKGDREILKENWMFVEYIRKGFQVEKNQKRDIDFGVLDTRALAILGRICFTHQYRNLIMELVRLLYLARDDSYCCFLIIVRSEEEKEIVHMNVYEDFDGSIFSSGFDGNIFSYQGKIYSFIRQKNRTDIFQRKFL